MANNIAFQAMGKTYAVVVNGAANTQSNVVTVTPDSPSNQYFLSNGDNNFAVYVAVSSSSNVTAALPETTPNYVIALPPYSYKVITGPASSATNPVYVRIIGDGTNATCYVTPGEGL